MRPKRETEKQAVMVSLPQRSVSTSIPAASHAVGSSAMQQLVKKLVADGTPTMWMLHFFDHSEPAPPDDFLLQEERQDCHYCQLKSWESNFKYPVGIVNDITEDANCLDPNFCFIQENVVRTGVEFAEEEFLSGCDCTDGQHCKMEDCDCLQDLEVSEDYQDGADVNPYYTEGQQAGCLKDWMLDSRRPIYECTDRCKCGADCPNRVVGAGRKVSLQIFRTADGRGWGLRATEDIRKGQFVGKYVGELLSPFAAQQRRLESKLAGKTDIYLFALDKFYDPEATDPRLKREPYEIDGEFMSGPTRFINHSCDPNLRVFAVVNDHANKPVHDLCFFALKDIERYTELTFDYVDGVDGFKAEPGRRGRPSKRVMEERIEGTACLCGASNCRKFLW